MPLLPQLEHQLKQISQLKSEATLLENGYTDIQSQMLGLQQKLMAKEGRLGELEAAYKVGEQHSSLTLWLVCSISC